MTEMFQRKKKSWTDSNL